MDFAGQAPALELLELDGPGGEALELRLPLGQAMVEQCVLDDAGQEAGHGAQGPELVVGEMAAMAEVDVHDTHERLFGPDQREGNE